MKITLRREEDLLIVVAEDGRAFPLIPGSELCGVAALFGWEPSDEAKRAPQRLSHFIPSDEMLAEATAFLETLVGVPLDDPGWFTGW